MKKSIREINYFYSIFIFLFIIFNFILFYFYFQFPKLEMKILIKKKHRLSHYFSFLFYPTILFTRLKYILIVHGKQNLQRKNPFERKDDESGGT